jgi:hypothetical protein
MAGLARREDGEQILVTGSLQNEVQAIGRHLAQAGEARIGTGSVHSGTPNDRVLSVIAAEQFAVRLKRSAHAIEAALGGMA